MSCPQPTSIPANTPSFQLSAPLFTATPGVCVEVEVEVEVGVAVKVAAIGPVSVTCSATDVAEA